MRWTAQRVEAGDVEQAGVESDLPIKRKQMDQEIHRIARENDQFAEAILE